IVFFMRTPTARVEIRIEGLDLDDRALLFVLDGREVSPDELRQPMELKVSRHELVVKRDGAVVRRYEFDVRGGKQPGIEVKEEVAGPADKQPPDRGPGDKGPVERPGDPLPLPEDRPLAPVGEPHTLPYPDCVSSATFSPDGRYVLASVFPAKGGN